MFEKIQGTSPYKSPTDMGVNMAGFAIVDDAACQAASRMEILRRYYTGLVDRVKGKCDECVVRKLEIVMQQAGVTPDICPAVRASLDKAQATGALPELWCCPMAAWSPARPALSWAPLRPCFLTQ